MVKREDYSEFSDHDLLLKYYSTGSNKWLGLLLEKYTLLLLGVSMKYLKNEEEARDSVQQIFLKVISELPRHQVTYFKSWLYMVAKNHCLMLLRKKQGKKVSSEVEKIPLAEEKQADIEQVRKEERLYDLLEESLEELNPQQKKCIELFYLKKHSYQQISQETGLSTMQVKSHIQNGKRNLKLLIIKKNNGAQNGG